MALTKVSGHIIDQPFDVGIITATNFRSGVATVGTMHVTGNLQVDGTTTTLDTVVTEVDKLEVLANNTTVGVAITQSGTGDILNLYDGATEVFTVTDGGKVGVNSSTPRALVDFGPGTGNGTLNQTVANYQAVFEAPTGTGNYTRNIAFASRSSAISAAINAVDEGGSDATGLIIATGTAGAIAERLRVSAGGLVGIGTVNPTASLQINHASPKIILEDNDNGADISIHNVGGASVISAAADIVFQTSNTSERVRISAATGNIGIGTYNPTAPLTVMSSSDPEIKFGYKESQSHTITWDSSKLFINADPGNANGSSAMGFRVDGSEKVRITSAGNLGIGTDNPGQLLHLNGASPRILLTETTNNSNCYLDYATPGVLEISVDDNDVDANSKFQVRIDGATAYLTLNSDGKLILSRTARTTPFIVGDGGM